jgi:hypothetical protein
MIIPKTSATLIPRCSGKILLAFSKKFRHTESHVQFEEKHSQQDPQLRRGSSRAFVLIN